MGAVGHSHPEAKSWREEAAHFSFSQGFRCHSRQLKLAVQHLAAGCLATWLFNTDPATHTCAYTCAATYPHEFTCTHVNTHICARVATQLPNDMYMHTHALICTLVHLHVYIHVHVQTKPSFWADSASPSRPLPTWSPSFTLPAKPLPLLTCPKLPSPRSHS